MPQFDLFKKQPNVNKDALNLAKTQNDYAVFLPSISAIYTKIVSDDNYTTREIMPPKLKNGKKALDFLDPDTNVFYYPAALYSAGHAILDPKESWDKEKMVHQRNRKRTVVIGDSGGFQIATGVLKWPWVKKKDQSDLDWIKDKDKVRMQILRWLEMCADYSMVLDVPTYSLIKFGLDPVTGVSLHPGVKTFGDCLSHSLENHEFFIKNRVEGATKFLNVLQGRTQEEGDIWWEAVKDLPFESWAFSSVQCSNLSINVRRLIIMRDGHYLDGRDWLHYLGNGKIKAGCALTTLQRALRKHVNENLTLSFDAASPFVMTAKGQSNFGYELSHNNMRFKGGAIVDDKSLKGSTMTYNDWIENNDRKGHITRTKIGDLITVGDICVRGYEDLDYRKVQFTKKELESIQYLNSPEGKENDKFKWSTAYKEWLLHSSDNGGLFDFGGNKFEKEYEKYQVKWPSSMDGFSYLLAMNHNTELHIRAIQDACNYQDQSLDIATHHVTPDLLEWKDLCNEIFTSERPFDLINKHQRMLTKIMGMDANSDISMEVGDFDEASL